MYINFIYIYICDDDNDECLFKNLTQSKNLTWLFFFLLEILQLQNSREIDNLKTFIKLIQSMQKLNLKNLQNLHARKDTKIINTLEIVHSAPDDHGCEYMFIDLENILNAGNIILLPDKIFSTQHYAGSS